jgi:hypothetical protein
VGSDTVTGRAGLKELFDRAAGRGYVLLTEIHDLHDPVEDPPSWPEEVATTARDA